MAITAALVKELRERTGAGMMECKKALTETNGDIDAAVEVMRKAGQAKADKKAGRVAAEGLVVIKTTDTLAAILEVNSETDFVSKGEDFKAFCQQIGDLILTHRPGDIDQLSNLLYADGKTVEEARKELVGKVGENIAIRRFEIINCPDKGTLGVYLHGTRIGVVAALEGGNEEVAKDIAMHIAASRPQYIKPADVPQSVIDKEKDIFTSQAAESGKPANIIEKMVSGRIQKYLNEISLYGQPFVKDPDQTVEKLLKTNGTTVVEFQRFEVGEGIEKKADDFVDEVMKQVQGTA